MVVECYSRVFRALFFFAPVCSSSCGCSLSWLHFVWLCGMVAVWSLAARCQVLECSYLLSGDLVLFFCCLVLAVGVDGVHVCFVLFSLRACCAFSDCSSLVG